MKQQYYKNHAVKKKWGQIFLKDQDIISTIIHIFNPQKNQTIIEIGPGLGALTQPMLKFIDFLILIELDPHLSQKLNQNFNSKIQIFNQDVMTINFYNLLNKSTNKLRLIGNLPYNIATKIIIYLFNYIDIIHDMHFMLQKEVGHRIIARPHNKHYGRLSILTQYHYNVYPILEISKYAFLPTPKVESIMIKFTPHNRHTAYPIIDTKLLSQITRLAFHQRRKIIKNSLSSVFSTTEMIQNGINVNIRAENITIQQFCILTQLLYNKQKLTVL